MIAMGPQRSFIEPDPSPAKPTREQILAVFAHYRQYHPRSLPHPNEKSKEWKLIWCRMIEGYSVQDLCDAIDGCHRSPFHCGQNDRQKKYQDLSLIMRDSGHVTQFIEIPERPAAVMTERTQRTVSAAQSYINRRLQEKDADDATTKRRLD